MSGSCEEILREYFGYSAFREGQAEVISRILEGRDVLGIMPTGAGKSICYQVPALMMPGITLVVSPLVSLMGDQVKSLVRSNVRAAYINSMLTPTQYHEALRRTKQGAYQIVYVAPERLLTENFLEMARQISISMVTVDEAHCVSQWGQDFRPSYLQIAAFVKGLASRPVVSAFTATATDRVRQDIVEQLELDEPYTLVTGFNRENLYFAVKKPKDKQRELLRLMRERADKSGIIYCATRKAVDEVCEVLRATGCPATRYHAGLGDAERRENQDDFLFDRKPVMVATNAFGMGIDKSNVSYVIHYNMPKNIESYYQEAGRAGRDGEPAECILLYSGQDVRIQQFLIEKGAETEELTAEVRRALMEKDQELLKRMTWYCTTTDCLRGYILRYFGDHAPVYCGRCGNCDTHFETVDRTVQAQKILSCVVRLDRRGRAFGKAMLAAILHGSESEQIARQGLTDLPTYGIMADTPARQLRDMIESLVEMGFLRQASGKYPTLHITDKAAEVLRGQVGVQMKLPREAEKQADAPRAEASALFAHLQQLRRKLASEENVPAYIIFSDATLRDMCGRLPRTKEAFLEVSGVGRAKMERYGDAFLRVIRAYAGAMPGGAFEAAETPRAAEGMPRQKASPPPAAGAPWLQAEEERLRAEYLRGMSVREISEKHQRTEGGIRKRLKRMGLLVE